MLKSVMEVPEQIVGRDYAELALLPLEWGEYLPLLHPVSLRVITVVHRGRSDQPEPWTCADMQEGRLVNVGHPAARDVAIFRDALRGGLKKSVIACRITVWNVNLTRPT